MKRLLGLAIGGLLVTGFWAVGSRTPRAVETGPPPSTVPPSTVVDTVLVPPAGQTIVTGQLATLDATGAVGPPIPLPLTLTVNRGAGGARIEGIDFEGAPATIVWDGGRPFELGGIGGIDIGAADVILRPEGATWSLDGSARRLLSGRYRSPTSVAVGREGLAEPHDGVAFSAGPEATIQTRGGVRLSVGATASPHLTGPGTAAMTGRFAVRTHDGESAAGRVVSTDGPYALDIARDASGALSIRAVLQGRVTTAP